MGGKRTAAGAAMGVSLMTALVKYRSCSVVPPERDERIEG